MFLVIDTPLVIDTLKRAPHGATVSINRNTRAQNLDRREAGGAFKLMGYIERTWP